MAYSLPASGSDWQEWKVRDVETGKDLDDHLSGSSSQALRGRLITKTATAAMTSRDDGEGTNYFREIYRRGTPIRRHFGLNVGSEEWLLSGTRPISAST
jgi:prolyl oligopeptidase